MRTYIGRHLYLNYSQEISCTIHHHHHFLFFLFSSAKSTQTSFKFLPWEWERRYTQRRHILQNKKYKKCLAVYSNDSHFLTTFFIDYERSFIICIFQSFSYLVCDPAKYTTLRTASFAVWKMKKMPCLQPTKKIQRSNNTPPQWTE